MKSLSVLIPSTFDRNEMMMELVKSIYNQTIALDAGDEVEIITDVDDRETSIGSKRQRMIERASGEYVVFIDSDDEISDDYLLVILNAIKSNPDVISFNGWMTTNGRNRENFKIMKDLPYITIKDANGNSEYLRFCNHLCPIKKSIALKIGYRDMKFAEDFDYAKRLKESGLIQKEVYINNDLYHYKFIKDK